MAKRPQKALSQCPECGFEQLEPAELISTYCQACGSWYETGRSTRFTLGIEPAVPAAPENPLLPERSVFCYRCGTTHTVKLAARNTICPGCSACIDLPDISILTPSSHPVDTRGKLFIGPGGALTNSWIVCGSARIEGILNGVLRSEGEVVLATVMPCACQIKAPTLVIAKQSSIKLTSPLETETLIVRGQFFGTANCKGTVHVLRGGHLEADICARSIVVEKGGFFKGGCQVLSRKEEQDPQKPTSRFPFFMLRPSPSY